MQFGINRKQIKADRLWKHWLSWLGGHYGPDLKYIENYNPNEHRKDFEHFQTHGRKGMTEKQIYGIHPILCAQKAKESTLTQMAIESMEWWSKGLGWAIPWLDTLSRVAEPMDRLQRLAILRTMKSIALDPQGFFERHPGILPEQKSRFFMNRIIFITQVLDQTKKF